MGVTALGAAAYVEQLKALMPRGRAWPRDRGALLSALLESIGPSLARVDSAAVTLLNEMRPAETTLLLPEWESTIGLPDECSSVASTVEKRRAAMVLKLTGIADQSIQTFLAIGRLFGITLRIRENDQAAAEAIPDLDVTDNKWRYVWWIDIPISADFEYFSTLSDVDTPLLTVERNYELECRLQRAAPAHTLLVIGYGAFNILTWGGEALTWGGENLTWG